MLLALRFEVHAQRHAFDMQAQYLRIERWHSARAADEAASLRFSSDSSGVRHAHNR
jgi:hypothetical protein